MIVDIIQYGIVAVTVAAIGYFIVLPWREMYTDYYVPAKSGREMLCLISLTFQLWIGVCVGIAAMLWAFAGVF